MPQTQPKQAKERHGENRRGVERAGDEAGDREYKKQA
jgi:hypothetical protein